jgi:hypothetical protein
LAITDLRVLINMHDSKSPSLAGVFFAVKVRNEHEISAPTFGREAMVRLTGLGGWESSRQAYTHSFTSPCQAITEPQQS